MYSVMNWKCVLHLSGPLSVCEVCASHSLGRMENERLAVWWTFALTSSLSPSHTDPLLSLIIQSLLSFALPRGYSESKRYFLNS